MVPRIDINKQGVPPTAGLDTYIRLQAHRIAMEQPGVAGFDITLERKDGLRGSMYRMLIRTQIDDRETSVAGANPDVFLAVRDAFVMLRMELPVRSGAVPSTAARGG